MSLRSTTRSRCSSSSSRTRSPASTSSPSPRRAPARRSPSGCRSSSAPSNANGRPAALVLVPTRELATQVAADLRPLADGQGPARRDRLRRRRRSAAQAKQAKGAHVARRDARPAARPDRAPLVALDGVRVLVLDEADRMLDMGFKPQVDRILRTRAEEPADDALLGHVRRRRCRARSRLHGQPVALRGGSCRPRSRRARSSTPSSPVTADGKLDTPRRAAEGSSAASRSSSFARSTAPTSSLASSRQHDIAAVADARQPLAEPARARARPLRVRPVTTLVATDVAARGLDVDDITHVINFDPPHGRRRLRPSGRPHRPRRPERHRRHLRASRAAGGRLQDGRQASGTETSSPPPA